MPGLLPFFSGTRQISIELTEPVVILRGDVNTGAPSILRGEVELVLSKPMQVTTVSIDFFGESWMLWPQNIGPKIMKNIHEQIIHEQNLVLMNTNETQLLVPGLHHWPFEFLIPSSLIETIEDERAKTQYYLQCSIQKHDTVKLRCRRNILILRTFSWVDTALDSYAFSPLSVTSDRQTDLCDISLCVEKAMASSGTPFPISLLVTPHSKHVYLESMSVILTEKRAYRLPEFRASRREENNMKMKLASAVNMTDFLDPDDVTLRQLKRAITTLNAHIPIGNMFHHKLLFDLPSCVNLNHSTNFNDISIKHHLTINMEFSQGTEVSNEDTCLNAQPIRYAKVYLQIPITILDCRLKEDFSLLPTYEQAIHDTALKEEVSNEHVMCPCYLAYRQQNRRSSVRQEWSAIKKGYPDVISPPPDYTSSMRD
ncbi:hypothetical protein BDF14DRAFT_1767833 [Spinellus fusiger]|nr:hypothetical protein BDF14DRAFT_1767833 [Spinellus fusiger]